MAFRDRFLGGHTRITHKRVNKKDEKGEGGGDPGRKTNPLFLMSLLLVERRKSDMKAGLFSPLAQI